MHTRAILTVALFSLMAISGCLEGTSLDPSPTSTVDGIQAGDALPDVTFADSGSFMLGTDTTGIDGGCGQVAMGVASFDWDLPATSKDGVAQTATSVTINAIQTGPQGLDIDLHVFDESGNELGSSTEFDADVGNGETVILGAMAPQRLVLEVRACWGAMIDFEIDGVATMVAAADQEGTGAVSVERIGNRWVARRTIVHELDVDSATGAADVSSGAGMVEFIGEGSGYRMEAQLEGYGESEQEARDRLAEIRFTHRATDDGILSIDAHARTDDGNWNDQVANLHVLVPNQFHFTSVDLQTIAGYVNVENIDADSLDAETTAGYVSADNVAAADMRLEATGGYVSADMRTPLASGTWRLDTTAGGVDLTVVETNSVGYDVDAKTTAGQVSFSFDDAPTTSSDCEYASCHKTARTNGYETRAVKVTVDLDTTAGGITAES